jgi:sodium-coupled monocarboxylate transporter 8/12
MMQRYLALPTVREARKSNLIYAIGMVVIITLCCYNGLLLYATYYDCDPLTTKLARAKDQMLPLLVMQTFNDLPGLSGFFIAGIFSAALSSISTGLNSMSCVFLEDFVKAFRKEKLTATMSTVITRTVVLCFGLLGIALVYVVQDLGTILQLTLSVPTACFGPLFGVYCIGFFMPWVNKRATFYGSLIGFLCMMLYVIKVQTEMARGFVKFPTKPVSTEGCSYSFNATNLQATNAPSTNIIYQISYLYYTLIGCVIVVLLSVSLTFLLGYEKSSEIDQRLLAPFVRTRRKSDQGDVTMTTIE